MLLLAADMLDVSERCVMTYGTAVEFPTGRIHEHVTQVLLYICVLILLYLPRAEYTNTPLGTCVLLLLLDMCPHTTAYVSSYY
jgi:hypothetical protein